MPSFDVDSVDLKGWMWIHVRYVYKTVAVVFFSPSTYIFISSGTFHDGFVKYTFNINGRSFHCKSVISLKLSTEDTRGSVRFQHALMIHT